jgi:hypothetical protein
MVGSTPASQRGKSASIAVATVRYFSRPSCISDTRLWEGAISTGNGAFWITRRVTLLRNRQRAAHAAVADDEQVDVGLLCTFDDQPLRTTCWGFACCQYRVDSPPRAVDRRGDGAP